ncbi:MAG: hypothetical protein EBZ47_05640 [Chlamydiae bacterium]|nr:hypothetical protein [Chlamydiota bacterium]
MDNNEAPILLTKEYSLIIFSHGKKNLAKDQAKSMMLKLQLCSYLKKKPTITGMQKRATNLKL